MLVLYLDKIIDNYKLLEKYIYNLCTECDDDIISALKNNIWTKYVVIDKYIKYYYGYNEIRNKYSNVGYISLSELINELEIFDICNESILIKLDGNINELSDILKNNYNYNLLYHCLNFNNKYLVIGKKIDIISGGYVCDKLFKTKFKEYTTIEFLRINKLNKLWI